MLFRLVLSLTILIPPLVVVGGEERPDERKAEVDRLIRALGSASFKEREEAVRSLIAIGEPAVPQLKEATNSKHADIRRNAEDALRAIAKRTLRSHEVRRFVGPPLGLVGRLVFSPDQRRVLAYCQEGDQRPVFLWELESGKEVLAIDMRPGRVGQMSFSPDGRKLAIPSFAEDDYTIRIWDVEKGAELRRLAGHKLPVYHAAFSPDGRHVLSCSTDRTLRLWDVEKGNEVRRIEGHKASVLAAEFSPDGRRAISASLDETIRVWEVDTGKELQRFKPLGLPGGAVFTVDGHRALSRCGSLFGAAANQARAGGSAIQLWDLKTGMELRQIPHEELVTAIAISRDGRRALSASRDQVVRLWDLEKGAELRSLQLEAVPLQVVFTADERHALTGTMQNVVQKWALPE